MINPPSRTLTSGLLEHPDRNDHWLWNERENSPLALEDCDIILARTELTSKKATKSLYSCGFDLLKLIFYSDYSCSSVCFTGTQAQTGATLRFDSLIPAIVKRGVALEIGSKTIPLSDEITTNVRCAIRRLVLQLERVLVSRLRVICPVRPVKRYVAESVVKVLIGDADTIQTSRASVQ